VPDAVERIAAAGRAHGGRFWSHRLRLAVTRDGCVRTRVEPGVPLAFDGGAALRRKETNDALPNGDPMTSEIFIEVPPSTEATLIEVMVELPGGTFVKLGFEAPQRARIEREEVRARRLAGEPMPRAKAGR
jgi:hypothetical protein